MRARLGTAASFCKVVVLKVRTAPQLEGRSVLDNKDAKFIPQTEEELKKLKVFACEDCGYPTPLTSNQSTRQSSPDYKTVNPV